MAITYTWKLTGFKRTSTDAVENAVFQTYWTKTGTDEDGNTGEFQGATPFDLSKIDPNNFTPYDQLTEETVLSWIKPIVTGSYAEHVNSKIADEIAKKRQDVIEHLDPTTFPWSTATSVTPQVP